MEKFEKQPAEAHVIAIEWQGRLPPGADLFSCNVYATRYPDMVVDNSVISNTLASISGTQTLIQVKDGQHGLDYRITFDAYLSNSDHLQEDVLMKVREL